MVYEVNNNVIAIMGPLLLTNEESARLHAFQATIMLIGLTGREHSISRLSSPHDIMQEV